MKLLLRNAKIYHPNSPLDGKRFDIFINKKTIEKIGKNLSIEGVKTIESDNLCVSVGWMDLGAQTGDPGYEHREDLESIAAAAAAGGFTAIAPFPNSNPVIQSKSDIQYIKNSTANLPVDFYPIGALTRKCEGMEMTEMQDMRSVGAVAFSDGDHSVQHAGVLLRALQYVTAFDGVIIHQPLDKTVAGKGQMHEGTISTMLGMRGVPSLAENMMIQRDLGLLEYADSRLHFAHVSTRDGVDMIRKAKKKGLRVTASVPALNLMFGDEAMTSFDTNLKVMPPLREQKDINALKKGLKDGTIDCVAANHVPHDVESKHLEFANADFGAIGLQTAFSTARAAFERTEDLSFLIEKFSCGTRRSLALEIPELAEGAAANLTVFDPDTEWIFDKKDVKSKSNNSPFLGKKMKGKVLGVVNGGKVVLG